MPKDPLCTAKLEIGDPEIMNLLSRLVLGPPDLDEAYPFMLLARRAAHVYNSTGIGIPSLERKGERFNPAFIHPDDLIALGVREGEIVEIRSQHGAIRGIVKPDSSLRRGMVSMTHAYGALSNKSNDNVHEFGSNVNLLLNVYDDYDPYSGIPRMSGVAVMLTRMH